MKSKLEEKMTKSNLKPLIEKEVEKMKTKKAWTSIFVLLTEKL